MKKHEDDDSKEEEDLELIPSSPSMSDEVDAGGKKEEGDRVVSICSSDDMEV
jgi:hypothetical protein